MKNIKKLLKYQLVTISPKCTLEDAAMVMKENDCGILLIENEKILQGVITDRDIIIRAIATRRRAELELVEDYMTKKVFFCKETNSVAEVVNIMQENNVARLIVKNNNDEPCSIISLGDIFRSYAKLPNILQKLEAEISYSNPQD